MFRCPKRIRTVLVFPLLFLLIVTACRSARQTTDSEQYHDSFSKIDSMQLSRRIATAARRFAGVNIRVVDLSVDSGKIVPVRITTMSANSTSLTTSTDSHSVDRRLQNVSVQNGKKSSIQPATKKSCFSWEAILLLGLLIIYIFWK